MMELNEEQLAQVTGGSTSTFEQLAGNFAPQFTAVSGDTTATASSTGKKTGAAALAKGASIEAGNSFTGLNVQSIG